MHICLVDADPQEPLAGLAAALAGRGCRVTLLSLTARTAGAVSDPRVQQVTLPAPAGLFVQLPRAARQAYLLYRYLGTRAFDLIHCPARDGLAYYTLLARTEGLALQAARVVVRAGDTRLQQYLGGCAALDDVMRLDELFLERRALELADAVVCDDAARQDGLQQAGVTLEAAHCQVLEALPESPGDTTAADWQALYGQLLEMPVPTPAPEAERPLVSVCLVHHERPRLLAQAVASLIAQDYDRLEVILVDDGSRDAASLQYLDRLEPEFAGRDWRIIRQQNAWLGAARNHAVRAARGDLLLFLDDDNVATPALVSTLVRVMQRVDADILTCATHVFEGDAAPDANTATGTHWVPLGAAVASGLFRNVFGDATALVRRHCFEALGGFTEDYGVGHEDWELFARAVLAGYRLETVPEPLLHYRVRGSGMLLGGDREASLARSVRPYLEQVPAALRPVLLLALGQEHARHAGPGSRLTPTGLLQVLKGLAAGSGRRDMVRRFVRVGRSQGWGVALRAALRYSRDD